MEATSRSRQVSNNLERIHVALMLTIRYSHEDQLGWRSAAVQKDVTGIPRGKRSANTSEDTMFDCLPVAESRCASCWLKVLALEIISVRYLMICHRYLSVLSTNQNPRVNYKKLAILP